MKINRWENGTSMFHKAKLGLGVAAIGMGMALVPAVSVSATVRTVRPLETSALCRTDEAQLKSAESTEGSSYEKAFESGNWPKIQKVLLSSYNSEGNVEKKMVAALQGAPGNVKAAAAVLLKFDGTIKDIIQKSTSMTQFSSSVTSAEASPKVQAALKTTAAYTKKLCPGLIPTTATTPTT